MIAQALSSTLDSKAVNVYIKLTAMTDGRDKIYRFVQYFSRFLAYHLARNKRFPGVISALTNLQTSLTQARKVMRLGKFVDCLKMAIKAILSPGDEITNLTTALARLSLGAYVYLDGLGWVASLGFFKLKNASQTARLSMKCWFASMVFNTITALYKLNELKMQYKIVDRIENYSTKEELDNAKFITEKKSLLSNIAAEKKTVLVNLIDMLIPLGILGTLPISNGVVGAAGAITSILSGNDLIAKLSG